MDIVEIIDSVLDARETTIQDMQKHHHEFQKGYLQAIQDLREDFKDPPR